MRISPTLTAAVLAPLLAAACASQPVNTAGQTSRGKIPAVLVESAADPYAPPRLASCKALAAEQVRLDRALGPESEAPKPSRGAQGGGAANRSDHRTLDQWLSSDPAPLEKGQWAQEKQAEFAARALAQLSNPAADKPDSDKPDSDKPDSGKSDSGKSDSGKSDSGKSDSDKPDSDKPDSGKSELDQSALDKKAELAAGAFAQWLSPDSGVGTKATTPPVETWLPSGAWVRSMSVAEQHSRRVQGAVAAGLARRAYLKGRAQSEGCTAPGLTPPIYLFPAPPHTPSSVAQN